MAERCEKLAGVDITAYLDDPGDARSSTVRAHVATCTDCREEVAAWQSLRAALATEGDGHPAENLLLAYADERASLAKSVVAGIEGHLAECPSCRDEVGVLGAVTIVPREAMTAAAEESRVSLWQRMLGVLTGPVWRPALAVAVLAVLMVPTLRWIDRDGALMQLGATQNREAMMVSSEIDGVQRSRSNFGDAPSPAAALRDEPRVDTHVDADTLDVAPPPASAPAAPMPEVSARPAQNAPTRPQPSQAPEAEDRRALDTQLWAQRRSASADAKAFSAMAMRKEDRGLSGPAAPPMLKFVPGGRVTLEAGDYDHVVLRVTFVRAVNEAPARNGTTTEAAGNVVVPANVTRLTIRVTTRDGRQSMQQVGIDLPESEGASLMREIQVLAEWFTAGENRIEIVEGEGQVVRGRLEVLLQRPERSK